MTYVTKVEIFPEAVRDRAVFEQLLPDRVQRQLERHAVAEPVVVVCLLAHQDGHVEAEVYSGFDDQYPLPKILRGLARKVTRLVAGVPV